MDLQSRGQRVLPILAGASAAVAAAAGLYSSGLFRSGSRSGCRAALPLSFFSETSMSPWLSFARTRRVNGR